ncbi:hypothetical protein ABH930_006244 [Kitasatospora sp. GAS204A]|uniref:hypothetical protein n=1 Tax=unclassified Kitasatospora TaxID=2633591 RepID=UPI0024760D47|nr:hypothetical protein [Kitasatospora sp. GAS204B]MDH6115767.1 hypothetical protein [Kitasatospora sp. GAS204B]
MTAEVGPVDFQLLDSPRSITAGRLPCTPWSKTSRPPGRRSTLVSGPLPNQLPRNSGEQLPDPLMRG